MTYEEKREFHKIISQILADEGLNQGKIKELVEQEIKAKVDKLIDQKLKQLDAKDSNNNFAESYLKKCIDSMSRYNLDNMIAKIMKDRILKVEFTNMVKE